MGQYIPKLQEGDKVATPSKTIKVDGRDIDANTFFQNLDYNAPNLISSEDDLREVNRLKSAILSREGDDIIRFENNQMIDPRGEFTYDKGNFATRRSRA